MSPAPKAARGLTLVEVLIVSALLGIVVLSFAPFQTIVLRSLHARSTDGESFALSRAARYLSTDAKAALDARIQGDATVTFTLPGERTVVWSARGPTLTRSESSGRALQRRSFPATMLARISAAKLLTATLRTTDGREARIDVWLRHAPRP